MLVGHFGMFGPEILSANAIKDFRSYDLTDVSDGKALLLVAKDDSVVRINRNGIKWYN